MKTNENNKIVWREIILECQQILNAHVEAFQAFINHYEENRKNKVLLLLARRIIANIRAIAELASFCYIKEGTLFFKLPIGLLLRNCLTDSITGLYLLLQDNEAANKALDLLNHDYANAKLFQFEVYRDNINFANFDDELAEHVFTLALEDNFLNHYNLNSETKEIKPLNEHKIWKGSNPKNYIPDGPNINPQIKAMWETLSADLRFGDCANNLYAYYRYFSQWEHFSEYGAGDAMASFGEDNINMPMTFGYIKAALDFIFNHN